MVRFVFFCIFLTFSEKFMISKDSICYHLLNALSKQMETQKLLPDFMFNGCITLHRKSCNYSA